MNAPFDFDPNIIDFDDNPVFSHPQDHYFDRDDCYVDRADNYLLANILAENTRKSASTSSSSSSGLGLRSWNFRKIFKTLAIILGVAFGIKLILFLIIFVLVVWKKNRFYLLLIQLTKPVFYFILRLQLEQFCLSLFPQIQILLLLVLFEL